MHFQSELKLPEKSTVAGMPSLRPDPDTGIQSENTLTMKYGESVWVEVQDEQGKSRRILIGASGSVIMVMDELTGDSMFLKNRNFAVIGDEMLKSKVMST